MRCADLNPDCALIADEAKDTDPVNGLREVLSTSRLVPGDSQITAAVDSISIAAANNALIKMIYYETLKVSRWGHYVERLGMRRVYDNAKS